IHRRSTGHSRAQVQHHSISRPLKAATLKLVSFPHLGQPVRIPLALPKISEVEDATLRITPGERRGVEKIERMEFTLCVPAELIVSHRGQPQSGLRSRYSP